MASSVRIEVHAGAVPDRGSGDVVVVVDVIRSSTTAISGIVAGRRCFPVPTLEAAQEVAARHPDALLVGELGGRMPYGFDLDNSPALLTGQTDVARAFVLLSTSGTRVMHDSARGRRVSVACLRNAAAQTRDLLHRGDSVVLVGAATRGEFREEDQLCCAWIAATLIQAGFEPVGMTTDIVRRWSGSPVEAILVSKSCRYLADVGRSDDLAFVLSHVDDVDDVFEVQGPELVPVGRATTAQDRLRVAG